MGLHDDVRDGQSFLKYHPIIENSSAKVGVPPSSAKVKVQGQFQNGFLKNNCNIQEALNL